MKQRKIVWIFIALGILGIFYLSSIPGLKILPLFKQLNAFILGFDIYFIKAAEIISSRLPVDTNELRPIRTASNDFYLYAKNNPQLIEFLLRKTAHMFVFFCLTLALFLAFNQYTKRTISAAVLAFFTSFLIAGLDEYRQSFVDGRVSSAIDVGIDLMGITMATFLILFSMFITRKPPK